LGIVLFIEATVSSMQEKNVAKAEGRPEPALHGSEDVRPLSLDDFKSAHEQVGAITHSSHLVPVLFLHDDNIICFFTVGLCECVI
jgi:hypothetical protein